LFVEIHRGLFWQSQPLRPAGQHVSGMGSLWFTPFTCKAQVVSQKRGVLYKWIVEEYTEASRNKATPVTAAVTTTEGPTYARQERDDKRKEEERRGEKRREKKRREKERKEKKRKGRHVSF
jgi:hypothetical protein